MHSLPTAPKTLSESLVAKATASRHPKVQVIPEGAGRRQEGFMPFFMVPVRVWARQSGVLARPSRAWALAAPCFPVAAIPGERADGSRTGRSPAGAAGAAGVLGPAVRDPIMERREPGGYAVVFRPHGAALCRAGAWLRSSLRGSRGCRPRGHGAVRGGQRDQSEARPRRPGAGARPAGDHALPVSGPAHPASSARLRAVRDLTSPSRRA